MAIGLTKEHLAKMNKEGDRKAVSRPPIVLFIVNKVNLVLQQRQRFDYYLSNRCAILFFLLLLHMSYAALLLETLSNEFLSCSLVTSHRFR